ncbi:MAG: NADH-quinone oxidoreductase subunit C, partial [Rickettsiales bacterium]
MSETLKQLGDAIAAEQAGFVHEVHAANGELCFIAERDKIADFLTFLRDDARTKCEQLMDVTAVDYPNRVERFEVVYNLLSVTKNHRIRV